MSFTGDVPGAGRGYSGGVVSFAGAVPTVEIGFGSGIMPGTGLEYAGDIVPGGVWAAGVPLATAQPLAAGGGADFVATEFAVVHEANNTLTPASKAQFATTRYLSGLPFRKPQFAPPGPIMVLSLVLTVEARKFTTSLPNDETRQAQTSLCRASIFLVVNLRKKNQSKRD